MRMFVWRDVHCDYTCGIVCILARTKAEALKVMKRKAEESENQSEEGAFWWKSTLEECQNREPDQIFDAPDGVGVSGGG